MISTPLMRGETALVERAKSDDCISIHPPHARGDRPACLMCAISLAFQSTPLMRGETQNQVAALQGMTFQSAPLMRGETLNIRDGASTRSFQSTPLIRGETRHSRYRAGAECISIRSPLTRGDSISLQKSIRIYVSLHNKTMIHRFSKLYKPLFAAQSPIFGVRSPRKSHDSFTFARPSDGRGITP